jgi:ArsR family transcriptional regulator
MKNLLQGNCPPTYVTFAKAVADETRQKIMQLCAWQRQSVAELVEQLGLAQPTVSHHLAILKAAGLVEVQREGRQVFYRLNQAQMARCCGRLLQAFAPAMAASQNAGLVEEATIVSETADLAGGTDQASD